MCQNGSVCGKTITFDDYFGSPFGTVIGAEWFNLGDRFASKLSSKFTYLERLSVRNGSILLIVLRLNYHPNSQFSLVIAGSKHEQFSGQF